jgi:ribonuclease P/MRP protein subunit RPP40
MPILSGIPQGTILGPLLFLIYINDLPNFCEGQADIYLFADDANLFTFINSVDDCLMLQTNLDKLQEWSEKWRIKLSVKHVMLSLSVRVL